MNPFRGDDPSYEAIPAKNILMLLSFFDSGFYPGGTLELVVLRFVR